MQSISLNGEWDLYWDDSLRGGQQYWPDPTHRSYKKWKAQVPGEVHLDLMRQSVLDDVYTGLGAYQARWVEEFFWGYRRSFDCPGCKEGGRWFLEFDGLDYTAKIYLNGTLAGSHADFFLPCRLEVTGLLREEKNDLLVVLESGLFASADKPIAPYKDASGCPEFQLHKRNWLRKPQNSFAWDWSPRLLNVGIHGDVRLVRDEGLSVTESAFHVLLDESFKTGTVRVKAVADAAAPVEAELRLSLFDGEQEAAAVCQTVEFSPEQPSAEAEFTVENPKLWFPRGYGEPYLYTLRAEVWSGGCCLWRREEKVGFRFIRVNQDAHPTEGHYFYFVVNGIPVFAKGANFVPADIIYKNLDRKKYELLLDRAAEANMNFMRVWGGGLYESDEFYRLCDEKGFLVWQEFIFACATYPVTDPAFASLVCREAEYQVRRLCGHPSLAAWCGNNEIEWGVQQLWKGDLFPDYALFHHLLPGILQREAPEYYYQPSSPYSKFTYGAMPDTEGDQHPWYVGLNEHDFWKYRNHCCRFPNEGGFMGPNGLKTLREGFGPGQDFVHSPAFEAHDNSFGDMTPISSPDHAVKLWLDLDASKMSLADYVYWGGFLQGEALTEYITNFRRFKFDCGSAIFWMYNDIWPSSRSWTVVDYYGRRTPSFYPVRRSFAPVIVCVAVEDGEVSVYGVNDLLTDWEGELQSGICGISGWKSRETEPVKIPANAAVLLKKFPLPADFVPEKELPAAELLENGRVISRHRQMQVRFHQFGWEDGALEVSREGNLLHLKSSVLRLGVSVDLDGEIPLSDNFFDLFPGESCTVELPDDRPVELLYQSGMELRRKDC